MRSLTELDVKNKRVLLRVDFNVPMDKAGKIIDDGKMTAALPTIEYLVRAGALVILMSHLGRPKGEKDEKYSLKPVALHLGNLLKKEVLMAEDCIGPSVQKMITRMGAGDILLLENVRFYPGEEKNDPAFSRELAALGEVFINDAFGSAHRAHSSTAGIAAFLPAYAGFLLEKEVKMLRSVLEVPEHPTVGILGGAKVADKLGLIKNFLGKMDSILIGGGMANTFLKAQGYDIGKSICEDGLLDEARNLLAQSTNGSVRILLPQDVVVAPQIAAEAVAKVVAVNEVPADQMIVDIGPQTAKQFAALINEAGTVIWNGPVGVYEYEQFASGTKEVALAIAKSDAVSVIGGGDTAAPVHSLGLEKQITHISTGGGATLEFLEGRELPGVKVCEE